MDVRGRRPAARRPIAVQVVADPDSGELGADIHVWEWIPPENRDEDLSAIRKVVTSARWWLQKRDQDDTPSAWGPIVHSGGRPYDRPRRTMASGRVRQRRSAMSVPDVHYHD